MTESELSRVVSCARNSSAIPPTASLLSSRYLPNGAAVWGGGLMGPYLIPIEAFTGLLAQLARPHHLLQQLWRPERRAAELLIKVLGDRQPDVEPDEVSQLQRAHRMAVAQL